jgi:hypothetical protein
MSPPDTTALTQAMADAWALLTDNAIPPIDRLRAARSLKANLGPLEKALAKEARRNGQSWTDLASQLDVTKQAVQQRFTREEPPVINMLTGRHPSGDAVWYGLEGDTPGDWNYARSREECAAAYRLARGRAEKRARQLGGTVLINDGGIDRGSGLFWDLYIGH